MDNIRQYQRLSDIKPSYQKLTLPYYNVSKFKIQHNINEIDLHYKGLGLWIDKTASAKQNADKSRSKKKGGIIPDIRETISIMDIDPLNLDFE